MNLPLSPSLRTLAAMDDAMDRLDFVCLKALRSEALAQELKTEANRIKACDSKLWCSIVCTDGRIILTPDSDSLWVKGLALCVKECVEAMSPEQAVQNLPWIGKWLFENGIIEEKRYFGLLELEKRVLKCAQNIA